MPKTKIIYSTPDLIIPTNSANCLTKQGYNIVKLLPGWEVYEPFPNGGSAPAGTYTQLWSPIFRTRVNPLESELQNIFEALKTFITDLNSKSQTICRIDCWITPCDDTNLIPHPINGLVGNSGFTKGYQVKLSNWLFCDIVKVNSFGECYGNIFTREVNNKFKLDKDYYTIHINSSWNSI